MSKNSKITALFAALVAATAILTACGSVAPAAESSTTVASTETATTASTATTVEEGSIAAETASSASSVGSTFISAEASGVAVTVVDPKELNEPENPAEAAEVTADDVITAKDGKAMQIVFLGDSQLDNFRTTKGIAYLVSQYCEANVYNLAMGGTAASLLPDEPHGVDDWNSRCFLGMVYAITGKVDPSFFSKYQAYNVFKSCDFSKTDIFVIEYGLNDYFNGSAVNNPANGMDLETYGGALHVGIDNLKAAFPNATFILCGPNYAQFFKGDQYLGDGNILSNGKNVLQDYARTADQLAQEFNIAYLDAYWGLGIDGYTASDLLIDGVHLNDAGRRIYAQALSRIILRSQGYDVAPGTDLDTVDMHAIIQEGNDARAVAATAATTAKK